MSWTPDLQELENRLNARLEQTSKHFRQRQAVIYVVVVVLLIVVVAWLSWQENQREATFQEFRSSIIANCEANRQSNLNYNSLIDVIIKAVNDSPVLTKAEKVQRVALYNSGRAEVGTCPRK